jgi:hypothetical protein
MNRDTAVLHVRNRFTGVEEQSGRIARELMLVQTTYEHKVPRPWFLHATIGLTVGPDAFTELPGGFLEEMSEENGGFLYAHGDDGIYQLKKRAFPDIFERYSLQAARPLYYDVVANKVWVYPTPDREYELTCNFMKADVTLEQNIENEWLRHAPMLMIAAACIPIANYVRQPQLIPQFAAEVNQAWSDVIRETIWRREQNLERQFGPKT